MGSLSLTGRRQSDPRGEGLGGPLVPSDARTCRTPYLVARQGLWGPQIPAEVAPWTW